MVQTARALIAWVSLALAVSGQATADLTPHAQVKAMARGVNILGYDPIWRDPAKARFRLDHLARIKRGGFDTVRVNLHAAYTAAAAREAEALGWALAYWQFDPDFAVFDMKTNSWVKHALIPKK